MCRDRSGGSIGLASVMAFLDEGAKVMMVGHNEENLIKAV
jgi:NADP-dependent 3-hydroxy acid dehydrogenase YdfG